MVVPILTPYISSGNAFDVTKDMLSNYTKFMSIIEKEGGEEDAEELWRYKFSLAYGSKVLLSNTELRLKYIFLYSLVGPNECG